MTPKFKDFSPEFHQLFKKIAQDFKKNKTANMQPMQDYFAKNEAEYKKFENVGNSKDTNCEIDLDDDEEEFKDNYLKITEKMYKIKDCYVAYAAMLLAVSTKNK